jgi:hypothetical protein
MARWTDKSGLKTEPGEPTSVETTLDAMNQLAASARHMKNPNNAYWAKDQQRELLNGRDQ